MTQPIPISSAATTRIRFRRAWVEEWEAVNPVLPDGVPGYDKTNNMLKVGDGVKAWKDLSYLTPPEQPPLVITGDAVIDAVMEAHIEANEPHPAYDDGPSLILLYQNAKV
jgi:hypothetical protein